MFSYKLTNNDILIISCQSVIFECSMHSLNSIQVEMISVFYRRAQQTILLQCYKTLSLFKNSMHKLTSFGCKQLLYWIHAHYRQYVCKSGTVWHHLNASGTNTKTSSWKRCLYFIDAHFKRCTYASMTICQSLNGSGITLQMSRSTLSQHFIHRH